MSSGSIVISAASEGRIDFLTRVDIDVLQNVAERLLHIVRQLIGYDAATSELLAREEVCCNELAISSCDKRARSDFATRIIAKQMTRTEAFGWVRVDALPGINRCTHNEWKGEMVPAEATAAVPHLQRHRNASRPPTYYTNVRH